MSVDQNIHYVYLTSPENPKPLFHEDGGDVVNLKDNEDCHIASKRMRKMGQRINYYHNLKAVRELNRDACIYLWTNAPEAVPREKLNGLRIHLFNASKLAQKSDMLEETTKKKIAHPDFSKNIGFAVDAVKYLAVQRFGGISIDLNFVPYESFPEDLFNEELASLVNENFFFSAKKDQKNINSLVKSIDTIVMYPGETSGFASAFAKPHPAPEYMMSVDLFYLYRKEVGGNVLSTGSGLDSIYRDITYKGVTLGSDIHESSWT